MRTPFRGLSGPARAGRIAAVVLIVAVVRLVLGGAIGLPLRSVSAPLVVVQSFSAALSAASTQISDSPSQPTTAGDLLVAAIRIRNVKATATVVAVTDSTHNSWTKAVALAGKQADDEIWYVPNAQGVASPGAVQVTMTTAAAVAVTVVELGGAAPVGVLDVTSAKSGSGTAASTGSTPPTSPGTSEIAVADVGWNAVVKATPSTPGYAPLPSAQSTVSGNNTGEQASTAALSTSGAQSYAATLSASVSWGAVIATFKGSLTPTASPSPSPSSTPTATPSATPTLTPSPDPNPTPTPTGNPIKHVVILYQENHSFDNVLGAWCAQTGRCAGLPSTVVLKGGIAVTPSPATDLVPDMGHSVTDQVAAMDNGLMDGWAGVSNCSATSSPPYACVSYYSQGQVPNITTLATSFAVSDHTFSMADSPSFGGHLYAAAASIDGFTGNNPRTHAGVAAGPGWGCDSYLDASWAPALGATVQQVPSCVPDPSLNPVQYPYGGAYRSTPVSQVPTIMDSLDAAGLPWRLYTSGVTTAGGAGSGGQYSWAICPSFAKCLDTTDRMNMVPVKNFLSDASNGTLPSFSIVLPQGSGSLPTSQHNGTSMAAGDNWIGQVASALERGPEWGSTALFITYDDCGCFYDHLPPGTNPDGTPQGIRVPLVIVSPYARAGYTDSTPATFASILAYAEQTLGLPALGVNDGSAYAFTNSFDYTQSPLAGAPMTRQNVASAGAATPDPNDPT